MHNQWGRQAWRQIIILLWFRLGDDRLVHRVTEAQNWQLLQLHQLPRKVNRKVGYQSRTSTTTCVLLVANNNGLLPQSIKLIGQQEKKEDTVCHYKDHLAKAS